MTGRSRITTAPDAHRVPVCSKRLNTFAARLLALFKFLYPQVPDIILR